MHIGFIIDGLAGGGAERVVLTLADGIARRGHRVTIVSLRSARAFPIPDGVDMLEVADSYRGPLRRQLEIGRRARQLEHALSSYLAGNPFDLSISNLPKTDRIVAATPSLAKAWSCLHGAVVTTQLANKRGFKRWLKRRQLAATYRQRRLILVSPGLAQDVAQLGAEYLQGSQIIPNPFDLETIRRLAALPCPMEGEDYLVHVGRFHPIKRHDRLLAAFRHSGFSGKLVLLGDGSTAEKQQIEKWADDLGIAERVVFAGFQDNPYPWLRAARALVLSSDSEGFGNVLVEALACGTPVVSTRCPFGPESILTGPLVTGLCDLNAPSLAAGIQRVLDAPPIIDEVALARFALNTVVDAYLALAESSLESP
ncbi:glycosyltransferase [Paludibacterium purpuratum]|uniref:Glycosyltransferase involved in cell wall biosynthesis n=1 Tax=Paludibacterium purpuratum TaxID=1144873 RepID=A0A4R7B7S4_9NEIS|nr:glycosyltransferase [Paludibacterium purpuratum]TDR80771.1 glycosyltransferase involved in cell wall biosynthesis [Paludibacterium purpuratum]